MKKIIILTALIASVLFAACTGGEKQFNKYGIAFTCPAEWKVTEAEKNENFVRVTIEKTGESSSGILSVAISTNDFRAHPNLVASYCEHLEDYDFLNITTQEMPETMYGGYLMSCTSYRATLQELSLRGTIYSITVNEQTILLVEQENIEDIAVNEAGFARIKETMTFFAE